MMLAFPRVLWDGVERRFDVQQLAVQRGVAIRGRLSGIRRRASGEGRGKRQWSRVKARTTSAYTDGCVTCGMCPAPSKVRTVARGSAAASLATTGAKVGGL